MIEPREAFPFPAPVRADDGSYSIEWIIPHDLPYFEGHFPGNPILPAVALLDASVELARRTIAPVPNTVGRMDTDADGGTAFALESARSAKFTIPVRPGDRVRVRLAREPNGSFRAEWSVDAGIAATLIFAAGWERFV